jgi:hypothetical protein
MRGRRNETGRGSAIPGFPDDVSRWLLPVLARVVRLGRGPAGLVEWVRERRDRAGGPADPGHLLRLAAELGSCLRQNALAGTRDDRRRQTVFAGRSGGPAG